MLSNHSDWLHPVRLKSSDREGGTGDGETRDEGGEEDAYPCNCVQLSLTEQPSARPCATLGLVAGLAQRLKLTLLWRRIA